MEMPTLSQAEDDEMVMVMLWEGNEWEEEAGVVVGSVRVRRRGERESEVEKRRVSPRWPLTRISAEEEVTPPTQWKTWANMTKRKQHDACVCALK